MNLHLSPLWPRACICPSRQNMDQIAVIAAAGLRSRAEALDMLSNNLANANTGGYKRDREFYSLFQGDEVAGARDATAPRLPVIQQRWTDFMQGEIQPTSNPLDVALNGAGFFAVNGPSGPLYTRNGAFKLSAAGTLTTIDGYPVRGAGGQTIQASSQAPIEISLTGAIQQSGQILGEFEIVDFANPAVLNKAGRNYFRVTDPAQKPMIVTGTAVEQGRMESSNVVPAEAAVRLIELMRQYEMLQKAVSLSAEMNKRATEDVARVGS